MLTDKASIAPRWAVWAAYAAVLTTLPSGLWRLGVAAGMPWGYTKVELAADNVPGSGSWYLIALSCLATAMALPTLGLVHRWGEAVPRWVPRLGGRPVRPRVVVIAAATGAVLLTLFWSQLVLWWSIDRDQGMSDPAWEAVVGFLYLPLIAWGPLLGAVTWDYRRRHLLRSL